MITFCLKPSYSASSRVSVASEIKKGSSNGCFTPRRRHNCTLGFVGARATLLSGHGHHYWTCARHHARVGGVAGLALLLPFTFNLDAYSAFAFMLGLGAVTSTSDTIPAVLFGVPGTSASQATVLDGHSMAKNGEAGRALSAAYAASLIGGCGVHSSLA